MAIKTSWAAGDVLASADITDTLASKTTTAMAVNAQTGTTYSFVIGDAGKTVSASNASASTYNIPLEASVPWVANTELRVWNIGAGTVTVTCTSGTLAGTVVIPQYGFVTFKKLGTNTWYGKAEDKAVPSGGMVLVSETAFSAASSVNINNCFTSTYASYLITASLSQSVDNLTRFRMRVAGADDSSNNYTEAYLNPAASTATETSGYFTYGSGLGSAQFYLYQPAAATATGFNVLGGNYGQLMIAAGRHNVATAYDGITIYPTSGTFTGTFRVYGLRNSL